MTVSELIVLLQAQPQDIQVAYSIYSEYCLLETKDIEVKNLTAARPDGWVHRARPDMPQQEYLLFPGH
jgi:hypothetical protein